MRTEIKSLEEALIKIKPFTDCIVGVEFRDNTKTLEILKKQSEHVGYKLISVGNGKYRIYKAGHFTVCKEL